MVETFETFDYKPKGVCASHMSFEIDGNKVVSYKCIGGCSGNKVGIAKLIEGMDIDDVISKLDGVDCNNRGTSCPSQIAQALREYKFKRKNEGMPSSIKLYNRYGVDIRLVKETDDCYELKFTPEEEGNYLRMGINEDDSIDFVDPSGGPMIRVGRRVLNLVNCEADYPELSGVDIRAIENVGGKIIVTLAKE